MSVFTYSAAERSGAIVKGEREAENQKALAQMLKSEGYLLLEAKERGAGRFILNINLDEVLGRLKPIGLVDKMFFTRNLGVMVGAGLPLTRALDALAEESPHPALRKIIAEVNESVIKGKSLAEALRPRQRIFGNLFVSMIEVGEATGKLTLVLKLLANQMKKDYDLRKRVMGAMIYPAIIIMALIVIGALMMIYVVPSLTATIKDLGTELPFTTQAIITVSDFMATYSLFVIGAAGGLVAGTWWFLRTRSGRELFDRVVLKLPIFGPLVKKFNTARFCRTLAYLITSGVPIVRSLEITAAVLGNTLFRVAAEEMAGDIQKGKQLHEILVIYPELFDKVMVQMVGVGEETGKISSMFMRLALFFEEEVNNTTKNLSTIIEPLLMLIVGAAVAFFAIAMLQPIYSSIGNVK